MFEEHDIDVALITESWLKDGRTLNRDVVDLEFGTGLSVIYKNRPARAASARRVGGGVSISFNKERCNLRERKLTGNKFELVAAVGKIGGIERKVAVYCIYIEPKMKVADLRALNELLNNDILRLKAAGDPLIFVGGDLNNRLLDGVTRDFIDMKQANFAPTRGNACLDIMITNSDSPSPEMWPPLQTLGGIRSDHSCLVISGKEKRCRNFTWVRKETRKHTFQAVRNFERAMINTNWDEVMIGTTPDELTRCFQDYVGTIVDDLFPLVTVRCRSNEDPWVTHGIRRLAKKKKRVFKREGKSTLWVTLRDKMDDLLEKSKAEYVAKVEKQGPRAYFSAVKRLSSRIKPDDWSIMSLFPGETPDQVGEKTAEYFTKITDQFDPLTPSQMTGPTRRDLSLEEVETWLRKAKKPNSSVPGDVLPRLMKKHHKLMAAPVRDIFNAVFRSNQWPSEWKVETTVVIPKAGKPDSLAGCRNISCTPFLSKVLESILLEDIKSEIEADPEQYGGIKGCSVNHLLTDLMEDILAPLDEGHPAVLLGIDYEKAFNRMDHRECLRQLRALGASGPSLALVRSFLTERSMRVRIGKHMSSKRLLKGGSPQGSIMGGLLYCVTTQQVSPGRLAQEGAGRAIHPTPPATPTTATTGETSDEDEGLNVRAWAAPPEARSPSDDDLQGPTPPPRQHDPDGSPTRHLPRTGLTTFKYIDDTTLVEAVDKHTAIRHVSSAAPTETVLPMLMDGAMASMVDKAESIGMRINCAKTQMLCVSADNGYQTTASLKIKDVPIESRKAVKLVGYHIGSSPGAAAQAEAIMDKFRIRFWSLINLRKAGMKREKLFRLYASFVRPVIETNNVIYHSMLTRTQSKEIERLQKLVVRLCFGFGMGYRDTITNQEIRTLEGRREDAVKRFVGKTLQANDRFSQKWFRPRDAVDTDIRRRRIFKETRAKTDRYYKSPLLYFQRIANDLMK